MVNCVLKSNGCNDFFHMKFKTITVTQKQGPNMCYVKLQRNIDYTSKYVIYVLKFS